MIPRKLNAAIQSLLTEIITECEPIVFNGDGYSEAWHQGSGRARSVEHEDLGRGAALLSMSPEVKELFAKYNVLSERELESRLEIYLHQYCLTTFTEASLAIEMAKTLIFPAAIRYQNELASTCANLKLVGYEFDTDTLDQITELVKSLQDSIGVLKKVTAHHGSGSILEEARYCCEEIVPAIAMVRKYADELEGWVADDLWPLPTYQEMLFIK